MTAPANLNFEAAGAAQGSAASWFIGSGSGLALGVPVWLAAGWGLLTPTGIPTVDAGAPIEAPNAFDSGSWTTSALGVAGDAHAAPDGTMTADKLADTGANVAHYIKETHSPRPCKAGRRYTLGFHLFPDAGSNAPLIGPRVDFGGGNLIGVEASGANVAAVQAVKVGSPPVLEVSAETFDLGGTVFGNWFIVALSFVLSADTSATFGFGFKSAEAEAYAGTSQGHYAWGAFAYADELTAAEAFDAGWASNAQAYLFGLVLGTSSLGAIFGNGTTTQVAMDSFEGGWGSPYLISLDSVVTIPVFWDASVDGADTDSETFDAGPGFPAAGWDETYAGGAPFPDPYWTSIVFDAGFADIELEDFDADDLAGSGWDLTYGISLGSPVAASWDGPAAESSEDFEEVVADKLYTADAGTDTFTHTAHGLTLNTVVRVVNVGGAFPQGLVRTLDYFVVTVTANTFQLSLTASGAAINITDNGTGDNYVRGSAALYWWGPDINPTV